MTEYQVLRQGQPVKVWATLDGLTEEWTGTVVQTTIEWGSGRRGVAIKVETSPSRFPFPAGGELSFNLDEWNVLAIGAEMTDEQTHPYDEQPGGVDDPREQQLIKDAEQVERAIERSKIEINRDIAMGRVPAEVHDFGELHDYVDANCYGGLCDDDDPVWGYGENETDEQREQRQAMASEVQEAVHEWLVAGRPR